MFFATTAIIKCYFKGALLARIFKRIILCYEKLAILLLYRR
jgi:hypothetical protein